MNWFRVLWVVVASRRTVSSTTSESTVRFPRAEGPSTTDRVSVRPGVSRAACPFAVGAASRLQIPSMSSDVMKIGRRITWPSRLRRLVRRTDRAADVLIPARSTAEGGPRPGTPHTSFSVFETSSSHRHKRRPARRRLRARSSTRSPHIDALGAIPFRRLGRNRPDQREAAPCRTRRGVGRVDHNVVPENGGNQFVLYELRDDASIKGGRIDLAPVLVHDVEVQPVTNDRDVLHRPDRVRVVASSAHHTTQPIANEKKGEE